MPILGFSMNVRFKPQIRLNAKYLSSERMSQSDERIFGTRSCVRPNLVSV